MEKFSYRIKNIKNSKIDPHLREIIRKKLDHYINLLNENFTSRNVELLGIVTYCCKALKVSGDPLTAENIVEEVKAWEGSKYTPEEILAIFNKVKNLIN